MAYSKDRITITIDPELLEQVKKRVWDADRMEENVSGTIGNSLARYYRALNYALVSLQHSTPLTPDDCTAILEALKDKSGIKASQIPMLYAIVHIGGGSQELVYRLQYLSYIECAALVDAADRYWRRVGAGEDVAPGELLR